MQTIRLNNETSFKVELKNQLNNVGGTINGNDFLLDIIKVKEGVYHLLKDNVAYLLEVVNHNAEEKILDVKVNNTVYSLSIKDKYDDLLQSLGLDSLASKKVNDIKAPMPGMVLSVLVIEGQEVKKGDSILVLEAMKMENVLKSPTDGIIKKIIVSKGIAVEKNQVLIQF